MTSVHSNQNAFDRCKCLLPVLAGPSLRGPLVGLNFLHGELHIEKSVFSCCLGDGVREVAGGGLSTCSLKQRLLDVNKLWYRLTQAVGEGKAQELLRCLTPENEQRLLGRLKNLSSGSVSQGMLLPPGPTDRASLVWYIALVATWRYGIRCHVIDWHVGSQANWAPDERFWQGQRRMILVADVDQLWDPIRVFDLEWIIGLAYQSEVPFWIGQTAEREDPLQGAKGERSFVGGGLKPSARSKAFGVLLSKARNRQLVHWLSKDMRSKLSEICEFSETTAVKAQRAGESRASVTLERQSEK